ncbi:MAG TPA: 23S rRNA (pseudouridine(1915)-N(3))-methyltransferase RlmH [Candidatus Paceibacterota bacterium]|nr:23S rRNA (pseudouridine(1915)-N(3))-methyltransferase RlmH [Candidatus Paceibacterota bacterium]
MKILFISVGKNHDPLMREAIESFSLRVSRYISCEWKLIDSSKKEGESGKKEEADVIMKQCKEGDYIVALDERGGALSSQECAHFFDTHLQSGTKRIVFIIGGSYGLHESVISLAHKRLSFSKMTLPHNLVRLILVEQVYRAFSILKGEKYHHQ